MLSLEKTRELLEEKMLTVSLAIHQDIHTQFEELSMILVKAGIIQFDHETEKYIMPRLEEILNEYSVNSEEAYSLSIKKNGDMVILSQAEITEDTGLEASSSPRDVRSEGATTISLESRVQENSKRGES